MDFKSKTGESSTYKKKDSGQKKYSKNEREVKEVLAPFLRRLKKRDPESSKSDENEHQKNLVRSKIKDVVLKLSSFYPDSIEIPTVLNETAEILREVTKSTGVSSYIIDQSNGYLTLNSKYLPKNGRHSVRYKIERGTTVTAFVAATHEFVMTDDVLGDVRFPQGVPGMSKNIQSVLCVPVLTAEDGKCIAVIELYRTINQMPYSALDLKICLATTGWMGAAIHQNNERLYLMKKNELNNYLTSLVEFFFAGALSFDKFVSDIIECSKLSVQAERGLFYLMEEEVIEGSEDEIIADVYEESIDSSHYIVKKKTKQRFGRSSKGFAAHSARLGKLLNISEAYKNPLFSETVDLYGSLIRSVISVPLKGSFGVLGVLQLLNKLTEPSFTKRDEIVLQNIGGYAYLACQHGFVKEQLRKSIHKYTGCEEMLKIHIKPCPDDLRILRYYSTPRKSDMPKRFFSFDWIITGKEVHAPVYAVFMFSYLLGEQILNQNLLTEFILTVKKSYRDNPYHNFAHAFTVCHCMFNVLHRNKESFTNLQLLALLIATICHDSDHVGLTNSFLQMTNHWLANLYWESPLEHHHYDICILIIESTGFLAHLSPTEYTEIKKMIKIFILATDLVQFFRNKGYMFNLLKARIFDWNNSDHVNLFLGLLMTVCDVSGQCKPFYSAKKVTEDLYREFYNQGDVEKKFGWSPLPIMDREKTSSIPENQIRFLNLICIPSAEILVAVFPNSEELLKQCVELRNFWADIQAKKVVEIWKVDESLVSTTTKTNSSLKLNKTRIKNNKKK